MKFFYNSEPEYTFPNLTRSVEKSLSFIIHLVFKNFESHDFQCITEIHLVWYTTSI